MFLLLLLSLSFSPFTCFFLLLRDHVASRVFLCSLTLLNEAGSMLLLSHQKKKKKNFDGEFEG